MRRGRYKIFSKAKIGKLKLENRLVRSATVDPSLYVDNKSFRRKIALAVRYAVFELSLVTVTAGTINGTLAVGSAAPELHLIIACLQRARLF